MAKSPERLRKEAYLARRLSQTQQLNTKLSDQIRALENIFLLPPTIRGEPLDLEAYRAKDEFVPAVIPPALSPCTAPDENVYLSAVKPPNWIERLLGLQDRFDHQIEIARKQFVTDQHVYEQFERQRLAQIQHFIDEDEAAHQAYLEQIEKHNKNLDEFIAAYERGAVAAVNGYCRLVLMRLFERAAFPQSFWLAYLSEKKKLIVEGELPTLVVIPSISEYKYIKSRDVIEDKPLKAADAKRLHTQVICAVTNRILHELFERNSQRHVQSITFDGFVSVREPSTGELTKAYLVSVDTSREDFYASCARNAENISCLKQIGGRLSSQPHMLRPVEPFLTIDSLEDQYSEAFDTRLLLDIPNSDQFKIRVQQEFSLPKLPQPPSFQRDGLLSSWLPWKSISNNLSWSPLRGKSVVAVLTLTFLCAAGLVIRLFGATNVEDRSIATRPVTVEIPVVATVPSDTPTSTPIPTDSPTPIPTLTSTPSQVPSTRTKPPTPSPSRPLTATPTFTKMPTSTPKPPTRTPAPTEPPVVPAECVSDQYSCNSFSSQGEAQRVFNLCYPYTGDIHRLDQNNNRLACESPADDPAAPLQPPGSSAVCSCSGDTYNCTDFSRQSQAQACFNYCVSTGVGDIHNLDRDGNGVACESLP